MSDLRDWDRPLKHLSDEELRARMCAIVERAREKREAAETLPQESGVVQYEYAAGTASVARETGPEGGTQLDRIERRLDSMERRLDSMERRLSEVETGLERVQRAVNGVRMEVEAARGDINVLAENLARVEQKVDAIADRQEFHARKLEDHDLRLMRLESERAG